MTCTASLKQKTITYCGKHVVNEDAWTNTFDLANGPTPKKLKMIALAKDEVSFFILLLLFLLLFSVTWCLSFSVLFATFFYLKNNAYYCLYRILHKMNDKQSHKCLKV